RIRDLMGSSETLAGVIDGLDRALVEVTEAQAGLDHLGSEIDLDPRRQEQVEERLFALRALARKQGVTVEDLPELAERTSAALEALDGSGDHVVALAKAESAARHDYLEAARHLSRIRKAAATALDQAVAAELPPLKLDKARFFTEVAELPESEWGPDGLDQVTFLVATNPGSDPGPIHRIASGGELARFMLALKVVLADADTVPTLVFDEVDMGIGGATAAAVGERLARLGKGLQVLVVTHSPQVAAVGIHHWRVSKSETAPGVTGSRVDPLSPEQRREEVARMLAGAEVTSEARAAADRLLAAAHS
ncbi:MAG: DNA repair protein RecN, partial [Rhodospirillaceae bacterium]